MPLRLFGGQGSGKLRRCPGCEREITAEATFCPFCYMVIRPEGTGHLREHLQGGRIPADVYLLRKMQVEDPNTGPVVRIPRDETTSQPAADPGAPPPAVPSDGPVVRSTDAASPLVSSPADPEVSAPNSLAGPIEPPKSQIDTTSRVRAWTGVHSLLKFEAPLPPQTHSTDEIPALFTWMLERDPVIPNNTELLEQIHAHAFREGPASLLGYEQHVLLQIADDLLLHPTEETLLTHLALLAAAYRRAAGAYHVAMEKDPSEASAVLWQISSLASRLRVEAWVYRTRHGASPDIARPRRRAPRASRD